MLRARPNAIRASTAILFAAALLAVAPAAASALTLTGQIGAHSFDQPVYVTQPPSGGPLLVVEQPGVIRAVVGGKLRRKPFLNIRGRVTSAGEQGLLSVAFPPGYRKTHLFYVYYVNKNCFPTGGCDIQIDEFRRAKHSPYQANRSSRRTVLRIAHRETAAHNGGQLQFDRRGHLFAGTGDGGLQDTQGDPKGHAQSKGSLLGKLLRINPRKHRHRHYTVPSNNPYVGRSGRDEIFARGLRNPWRFSIDRVGTAERLVIGDVGWGAAEEVDYESLGNARGANFGWNRFEGFLRTSDGTTQPASAQPDPPIFSYLHNGGQRAIIGGYIVHDATLGAGMAGRYLYTDLVVGELRSLVPGPGGASDDRDEGIPVPGGSPVSFGRDKARHIYLVSQGTGGVYRIAP